MAITVKALKEMIDRLNIPDDAEIWMEYPAAYGVIDHKPEAPTFERSQDSRGDFSDWIVSTSLGWSSADKRVRICHHF